MKCSIRRICFSQEDLGHKQMLRFARHDSPFGCGRWSALGSLRCLAKMPRIARWSRGSDSRKHKSEFRH